MGHTPISWWLWRRISSQWSLMLSYCERPCLETNRQ
jgi:hypothetical protein